MGTTEFRFTSEDITTVFDALHGFDPEEIACALLDPNGLGRSSRPEAQSVALKLATSRVSSLLHTLFMLGPNCEASTRVILPWKTSHLSQLSCMSWPDALGVRIVVPSSAPRGMRARFLANALAAMSYV